MFTIPELQLINFIIQVNTEGKGIQYPLAELQTALEVFKALDSVTVPGKKEGEKLFKESKIDFTTEQKAFILKAIEGRSFSVVDAEAVFSIQKKLK